MDLFGFLLIFSLEYFTNLGVLPNQELSGAKSELLGETVGVCSSYKRGDQPPYNSSNVLTCACIVSEASTNKKT